MAIDFMNRQLPFIALCRNGFSYAEVSEYLETDDFHKIGGTLNIPSMNYSQYHRWGGNGRMVKSHTTGHDLTVIPGENGRDIFFDLEALHGIAK